MHLQGRRFGSMLASVMELLFGLRRRVTPRAYAGWGFGLFALKYAVDWALSARFATHPLGLFMYLNPLLSQRLDAMGSYPTWLPVLMAVWSLPFVWVGLIMSARRAVDAGKSPWLSLLFFVPVVNYFLIVGLCVARSVDPDSPASTLPLTNATSVPRLQIALKALFGAIVFSMLAVPIAVYVAQGYGGVLFMGTPFVIGVISGVLFNREAPQSLRATLGVATIGVTLCGGLLLIFALEGVLCLAMAAALALPLTWLGAVVGRSWSSDRRVAGSMVVAWPLLVFMPWNRAEGFPVRAVVSSIEIDAPPERVWPNIVGFSELPPPSEWLLKTGIACPLRAHIEGQGVGAVRYCEFSTGPFVEPITTWEPPLLLAFDVAKQPPSMKEWSPYEVVHAPHVVGSMQSVHGEFRITPLPNGRSRLQGTTWYRLKMAPTAYWTLYGDAVIHVIHTRVLRHIRNLSEASQGSARASP